MPITKAISSKTNTKQVTNADFPINPNQVVTSTYGPVASASGQTVINMGFAVSTANTANFLLIIDGKVLSFGASNDYTFTSIQANGTSSQVTLNQPLSANLNIQALYLGVVVPTFSLSTLTASVNSLTAVAPNILLNGNFDFWQRGTSTTVANGNSTGGYQADRWYVKNSLGTSGVITYSRVAPTNIGSAFGASVQISTAPTASQTNGTELYQTLENLNSIPLLNQTLSFSALLKGLNNVTSVGLQFYYATSESRVNIALGAEQTVAVTNSGFALGKLQAVNVGTTPTSSGSIGVRIRILGVSSGNTYDLNNGFVVEQAMMNIGTTAANFQRAGRNVADELTMCQRYFEVVGGSASANRPIGMAVCTVANTTAILLVPFSVKKRVNAVGTTSGTGAAQLVNATINTTSTNIVDAGCGVDSGQFTLTFSATLAGNAAIYVIANSSSSKYFFESDI